MAYKIKSMLKQTSGTGLSANYYLKKNLDSYGLPVFDNEITDVLNPNNEGKSIAKVTEKFTTPEIIKAKDTARESDEKKQIRRAGREAAKNAEVDFVKATPMGSDYFSLMAATAENIASRAGQKRKARKAAEEKYKQFQKEGSSNFDGKGLKKGFKGTDLPEIKSDVKRGDFFNNTFNTFNPERDKRIKAQKKSENIKEKNNSTSESIKNDINTKSIQAMTTFPQTLPNGYIIERGEDNKNTENLDRKYYYEDGTRKYNVKTNPITGEDSIGRNLSPASRDISEKIRNISEYITDAFKNTFSVTNVDKNPFSGTSADARKAKLEQARQEREQRQKERELDLEKIKQIQGLPMMGDGFNKGMSRKNKYKK